MIRNTAVTIGIASTRKNSQGGIEKTWDFGSVWDDSTFWDDTGFWVDDAASFICDVQPYVLNDYTYQNWGISDLDSNSKLMFMDQTLKDLWTLVNPINRIQVQGGALYDILGSNDWQKHHVAIMKPVQGGL